MLILPPGMSPGRLFCVSKTKSRSGRPAFCCSAVSAAVFYPFRSIKNQDPPFYTPFHRVSRKNSMAGGAAKPCLFCDDILSIGAGFVKQNRNYQKRGQAHDCSPTTTDKPQIHRPQRGQVAGSPLRRHLLQRPYLHRPPQEWRRCLYHVRTQPYGSEGIHNAHPCLSAHRLLHHR